MKFGFDWPSGFRERCLKIMDIHVAPGQGKTTLGGQMFFKIVNFC